MSISDFCDAVSKLLPCKTIYYPGPMQIELFLNVNDKDVSFVYDEEFIRFNDFDDIMARIDDDLFTVANRINKGKII